MKVIWSPLAVARIREAAQYIGRDNRAAARDWVESIFDRVDQVADSPTSGQMVPELRRKNVRELTHGRYRIIYRTEEKPTCNRTLAVVGVSPSEVWERSPGVDADALPKEGTLQEHGSAIDGGVP